MIAGLVLVVSARRDASLTRAGSLIVSVTSWNGSESETVTALQDSESCMVGRTLFSALVRGRET